MAVTTKAFCAATPAGLSRPVRRLTMVTRAQAQQQQQQQQQAGGGELPLVGPSPQRFTVAEGQIKEIASAAFPALARAGSGAFCMGYKTAVVPDDGEYAVLSLFGRLLRETSAVGGYPRPAQPLVLYEFEGCPFCRKAREAVALLDLDVLFKPCPQGGPTWRPEAAGKAGKAQFPYLEDPNTGAAMLESDAIIAYLFDTYGPGADQIPLGLRLGPLTALSCGLAMLPRMLRGSRYRAAKMPQQPLVLWGYEASPFVKVVRERLCELELPHVLVSCARGSPKRQQLYARRGHFQVPYLEDPNGEGVAMFESAAILAYLEETYAQ